MESILFRILIIFFIVILTVFFVYLDNKKQYQYIEHCKSLGGIVILGNFTDRSTVSRCVKENSITDIPELGTNNPDK